MNTSLESKTFYLKDRAHMFARARSFFQERGVIEVDCPAITQAAPIDQHIDVMQVIPSGYLHTSPEYGMKRLLAEGMGDIYQISHVFRAQELGSLHNPEFTMAEWYRIGFTFEQMIAETLDFIRLFVGPLPSTEMAYRALLKHHLSLDYLTASQEDLLALAHKHSLDLPKDAHLWDCDTLLQLLISFLIEPKLGEDSLFVLTHFPASQAALSKTALFPDEEAIGYRFEVYYRGVELANGYHELTDVVEQRRRLEKSNAARLHIGKSPLTIDERFLAALEKGIPDCCGVAVGFDRLMQLKHSLPSLKWVIPFSFDES